MRDAWASLQGELSRQADRGFLWLVVAFAAGIVAFFACRTDPPVWVGVVTIFVGLLLYVWRARLNLPFVGLMVIALGLGYEAAQIRTWSVATPLLERETRPFMLSARVVKAEKRPTGHRIVVTDFVIPGLDAAKTPTRMRVSIPASHGIPNVGERIVVRAVVAPAEMPVVPGGFQFQRFLYFERIGGTGYTMGRWQSEPTTEALSLGGRFHAWAESLRRHIGDRITSVIPGADGAVTAALINGEQGAIPEDLQEAYRVAGIAHLLSISGVHMSLLAGVIFFTMRRLLALVPTVALRMDTKKAAAWASLAATAFYLMISGMSVPAVRSFLMIAIVMLAVLLDRTALSLRTVAWAALALMAVFPDAVVGASFQMSFLAVLALISLYEQTWLRLVWRGADGRLQILRVAALYLAGLIVTDIAAGGMTSLLAAYHFNRLPTYSVITNFLAVPLTGLWIMPFAILSLILMPFGLDALPLRATGAGVGVLDDLARSVAAWPGAQVHVPPMQTTLLVLAVFGLIFVCLWKGRLRWLGLAAVLPALVQPYVSASPDVLVDNTARVFAVSDRDGHLVLKPGRAGSFIREVWTDRYGKSEETWPEAGHEDSVLGLACDADGCVLARAGRTMLLAFTATSLVEDCREADAIISVVPARDLCRRGRVIDLIDLKRDGATAFWIGKEIRTRTVADAVGDRVWMRGVVKDVDEESGEERVSP